MKTNSDTIRTIVRRLTVCMLTTAWMLISLTHAQIPALSDGDWASIGVLPGPNTDVDAMVADDSGNLYIAGGFDRVGEVSARGIAKWDGSEWSPRGFGVFGVSARAVP